MSDSYTSIIEGLEDIKKNTVTLRGVKDLYKIENYIVSKWIDHEFFRMSFVHDEKGYQEYSLDEYIQEYCNGNLYEVLNISKLFANVYLEAKWISEPFKNWQFIEKMKILLPPTRKIIGLLHSDNYYSDIMDGILNVFFRLTNYNNGAIVPIVDLIDLPTAKFMSGLMGIGNSVEGSHVQFITIKFWNLAIQGVLFTLHNMNIKFPAPYYPSLAVLEKKDTLQQALIDLELSLMEYKEKKV